MIFDFIPKGNLQKLIKEKRTFSEFEIQKMLTNILKALDYLDSKGVMHRDLKPENILVRSTTNIEDLVIADFGLATKFKN